MNSGFSDAMWKRKYEEADRLRKQTDLHIRMLYFCLNINLTTSSLKDEIDKFVESTKHFVEAIQNAGGLATSYMGELIDDVKKFAEARFDEIKVHATDELLSDKLENLCIAVGLKLNLEGEAETHGVVVDHLILAKIILILSRCMDIRVSQDHLTKVLTIGVVTFEGVKHLVTKCKIPEKSIPRVLQDSLQDCRPDLILGLEDCDLGLFLARVYAEVVGGWLMFESDTVQTVIPVEVGSAATTTNKAPSIKSVISTPPLARPVTPPIISQPAILNTPPPVPQTFLPKGTSPVIVEKSKKVVSFGKILQVLIVDDNPLNLQVMRKFFDGHNVITSQKGNEAVDLFRSQYFSIVFMDIELPDISGIEAAKMMIDHQKRHARPLVPIVAVTGHDLNIYEDEARTVGITDFIKKPPNKAVINHLLLKYFQ